MYALRPRKRGKLWERINTTVLPRKVYDFMLTPQLCPASHTRKSMNFRKLSSIPARDTERNKQPNSAWDWTASSKGPPTAGIDKTWQQTGVCKEGRPDQDAKPLWETLLGLQSWVSGSLNCLAKCCSSLENLYQKCWYWKESSHV